MIPNAVLKYITASVPEGENWSVSVPAGKIWYLQSIGAQLTTGEDDERPVYLFIIAPNGVTSLFGTHKQQAANVEAGYILCSNGIAEIQLESGAIFGGLPKDFPLLPGSAIHGMVYPITEMDYWNDYNIVVYEVSTE